MHIFLSFILGVFSAFSMPPWHISIFLVAGLSGLYILLERAPSKKSAFFIGWCFGFGYFLFGLSWIGNALLVEGNDYAWAWPLAVCGLPLFLGLYSAVSTLLLKMCSFSNHTVRFLAFVVVMGLTEWARGHLFTGFPWNLFGYTWGNHLEIVQIVWLGTVYFLTFLTIFWCAAPGFCFLNRSNKKTCFSALFLAVASFAGCYAYGAHRMSTHSSLYHESFAIKLVQANIPQAEKWDSDKMLSHFMKHIELSKAGPTDQEKTTYIIWPETALNYWLMQDDQNLRSIQDVLRSYKGNALLFTGILNYDPVLDSYTNALVMMDKNGQISNIYNKSHLVPFGEYIPFQNWIPLRPVARFKGFHRGESGATFTTPEGFLYSPLICYEIIFPGKGKKSDFILNVTNDSWYGDSAGPYQHLMMAVFRAVETGTPVLRSAGTGISAVIGPTGKIENQSTLFREESIKNALPLSLTARALKNKEKTDFSR